MSLNQAADDVRRARQALDAAPGSVTALSDYSEACHQLIAAAQEGDGLTDEQKASIIERARQMYAIRSSDDIEIYDDARFSVAEDGVWVQAWCWVPHAI